MWKVAGEEYQVGDSILIASGLFSTKIERFRVVRPRRQGGGGWFGGGADFYLHASNGKETVRITKRGRVADDVFVRRRVVKFADGIATVAMNEAKAAAEAEGRRPQVSSEVREKLEEIVTTNGKILHLAAEGYEPAAIASILNANPRQVLEVLAYHNARATRGVLP